MTNSFGKKGSRVFGSVICVTGSLTVKTKRSFMRVIVNKHMTRAILNNKEKSA